MSDRDSTHRSVGTPAIPQVLQTYSSSSLLGLQSSSAHHNLFCFAYLLLWRPQWPLVPQVTSVLTVACLTFQVFEFPGGAIQWARYRNNVKDYLSIEEEAFGSSLNSQRSQMTLGTLRIKNNGLRAPHWHFNANEHGYLVQVWPVCLCSAPKCLCCVSSSYYFSCCKTYLAKWQTTPRLWLYIQLDLLAVAWSINLFVVIIPGITLNFFLQHEIIFHLLLLK